MATAAGIVAVAALAASKPALAQTAPAGDSMSIQHDSEKARAMKEPSFQTREERLAAKPLDWNTTIGKPTPRTLTAKERKALKTAKRGASAGGAPDPKAEEEARRLHPDDWK
ncbi:hypothetical protein [Burkholderia alba]|uniref:hypothetical protein n=1 Tax=Burkholderia alba TaxID=2683677 RepID=UPI002B05A7C6|nr:hypothetical protein [Burkholderia alba]